MMLKFLKSLFGPVSAPDSAGGCPQCRHGGAFTDPDNHELRKCAACGTLYVLIDYPPREIGGERFLPRRGYRWW